MTDMGIVFFIAVVFTFFMEKADLCSDNKFGYGCLSTCHCRNGAKCDVTTGTCLMGCEPGWNGLTCQKENIAFRRFASQKDGRTSRDASFAVDGDLSTCSLTKQSVPGWWTLQLDQAAAVDTVTLTAGRSTNIKDWRIYVGMDDHIFSMTLCAAIRIHSDGATIRCEKTILGQYVKVVNRVGPVVICELRIHVCSQFWFGSQCEKRCNCADQSEVCDPETGACATGCSSGWMGLGCQTACRGRYGDNCVHPCGTCDNHETCDHVNGMCRNGCQAGWTGEQCVEACRNNTFGRNCNETCGYCHGNGPCDISTGTCKDGCQPGYGGDQCIQECNNGLFGEGCKFQCGNCSHDLPCDRKSGVCEGGCEGGYEGAFCTQECLDGYYGIGCAFKCTSCYRSDCNKQTGSCLQGCMPGYTGDHCDTECTPGYYGVDCRQQCGHCNHGEVCDPSTGACASGCLPGYNGSTCSQRCPEGFYGVGCAKCGVCKASTTCDVFTGVCPEGCGHEFLGDLCQESAAFSDEGTPQLQIFLGTAVGTVGGIMTLVIICLVLMWQREHLADEEEDSAQKQPLTSKLQSLVSLRAGSFRREHDVSVRNEHDISVQKEHEIPARKEHEVSVQKEHELPARKEHEVSVQKEHEVHVRSEHDIPMQKQNGCLLAGESRPTDLEETDYV